MRVKTMLMSLIVTLGVMGTVPAYGATVVPTSNKPGAGKTVVQGAVNSTTASNAADGRLHNRRHRHHRGRLIRDVAKILTMQPSELRSELRSGKSIIQVAASKGISEQVLTSKLRANLEERLKRAEQSGKLTAGKADKIRAHFDRHISERLNRKGHGGKGPSGLKAS